MYLHGNRLANRNNRFGQQSGGYLNLQAENTTDFKSISTNDMLPQSFNGKTLISFLSI
jgi:hypothetical protein